MRRLNLSLDPVAARCLRGERRKGSRHEKTRRQCGQYALDRRPRKKRKPTTPQKGQDGSFWSTQSVVRQKRALFVEPKF